LEDVRGADLQKEGEIRMERKKTTGQEWGKKDNGILSVRKSASKL